MNNTGVRTTMKLRHVRAVAVVVGVVVALTGARHSSGGGCGSSGSAGPSTGSGGSTSGSHYDDDDDHGSSAGAASGGDETAGTGRAGSADVSQEVRIVRCAYDATRGIVARVRAANPSASLTYTYAFTVTFKASDGSVVRTSDSTIPYVSAGTTETLDVTASHTPADGGDGRGSRCELDDVTRTAV
ncbi:hypothetical protein ABT033_24380 [Streptomyces pharetrae]|uniref:hypothetical protein n=1 Tax=Streptomyces pharetrae TaxID=291370 RepID=UPI0033593A03